VQFALQVHLNNISIRVKGSKPQTGKTYYYYYNTYLFYYYNIIYFMYDVTRTLCRRRFQNGKERTQHCSLNSKWQRQHVNNWDK